MHYDARGNRRSRPTAGTSTLRVYAPLTPRNRIGRLTTREPHPRTRVPTIIGMLAILLCYYMRLHVRYSGSREL